MFRSALVKLTGLYLLVIMVLSLSFSVVIFQLATRELNRGFRQQDVLFRDPVPTVPKSFRMKLLENRDQAVIEAQSNLFGGLLMTNILVLLVGGGLSYIFALKTLEPIERSHKALEQFTADASHELRTPITAMKSELEVALMHPKLTITDAKHTIISTLEELDGLTRLSENLLAIARFDRDAFTIKKQKLSSLVDSAISKTNAIARQKNIIVSQDFDQDIFVKADKVAIVEVIVILLDNAVKYSPKDTKVTIQARKQQSMVEISVVDQGIGIANDSLDIIFERFYQEEKSRSKNSSAGHGLGLSIAKQIIDQHEGKIWAEKNKSGGTTIRFMLPVV